MWSDVFEDKQIQEIILTFDSHGLNVILPIIQFAFQQVTGLLLTLFEDTRFYLVRFLSAPLYLIQIFSPTLLFSCDIQIFLNFYIRQYFICYVFAVYSHLSEYHISLPRQQEIFGRKHLKFIPNELLHPLYLIQLSLQFYMITYKHTPSNIFAL